MIKPKYFDESRAPMTYYMILKVLVIIWIIVATMRLFAFMSNANVLGVIEMAICLTLDIFIAVGLYKKKWSGVIALYSYYAFQIVDVLLALVIYAAFGMLDAFAVGECVGGIVGVLVWAIPTWVYFSKRRPLFMPYTAPYEIIPKEQQAAFEASHGQNSDIIYEQQKNAVKYCYKCGFELLENSVFCSNCGAEIPKE